MGAKISIYFETAFLFCVSDTEREVDKRFKVPIRHLHKPFICRFVLFYYLANYLMYSSVPQ